MVRKGVNYHGGMVCPDCGAHATGIIDGRPLNNGAEYRRRRECLVCAYRFTTYERVKELKDYKSRNRRAMRVEDV
jgi:transcriptional regulator NrdR family protein